MLANKSQILRTQQLYSYCRTRNIIIEAEFDQVEEKTLKNKIV